MSRCYFTARASTRQEGPSQCAFHGRTCVTANSTGNHFRRLPSRRPFKLTCTDRVQHEEKMYIEVEWQLSLFSPPRSLLRPRYKYRYSLDHTPVTVFDTASLARSSRKLEPSRFNAPQNTVLQNLPGSYKELTLKKIVLNLIYLYRHFLCINWYFYFTYNYDNEK